MTGNEPIQLVPPNPGWPARFELERAALEEAIGEWACGGIHHIGSTSVPDLEPKPIIDILVGVSDLATAVLASGHWPSSITSMRHTCPRCCTSSASQIRLGAPITSTSCPWGRSDIATSWTSAIGSALIPRSRVATPP